MFKKCTFSVLMKYFLAQIVTNIPLDEGTRKGKSNVKILSFYLLAC